MISSFYSICDWVYIPVLPGQHYAPGQLLIEFMEAWANRPESEIYKTAHEPWDRAHARKMKVIPAIINSVSKFYFQNCHQPFFLAW
jgi:hypothetical protein